MKTPSIYDLLDLVMSLVCLYSTSDSEILLQGWGGYDAKDSKTGWLHNLEHLSWLCVWMDKQLSPRISYENPASESVTERVLICGALQTAIRLLELNRLSADQIRQDMFKDVRPGLVQLCSVICMAICDISSRKKDRSFG